MSSVAGDIHGRAGELKELLTKLGYSRAGDVYRHDTCQVIFFGDFIDRGPHQRRVLELVLAVVANGAALAVMGNHEFNAIAYHTPDGSGGHLRARNRKIRSWIRPPKPLRRYLAKTSWSAHEG